MTATAPSSLSRAVSSSHAAAKSNGAEISSNGEASASSSGDMSIYSASSLSDIKNVLSTLHTRESSVTTQLDTLLASQKTLHRELGRLDLLRAKLGAQVIATRSISNNMLSGVASSADRISSAVQQLHKEQERVKATLAMVEQVVELKACVLGVAASMGVSQDWEMAANHLHRASKIPREIVDGEFASKIVPTTEVPDAPSVTLDNAAESLCGLFLREFDKAVSENDSSKITRFFKLFPLIGRAEVGLDVYGRYVCQGVASRARSNLNPGTRGAVADEDPYFYATALTKLFDQIAHIIDGHGPLVERHYGPGSMSRVIERLQVEADVQGGIILETWSEERRVDRKLTDIKSYAFTFLVQSFLPSRAGTGTPRVNSPAPGQAIEDESVDMKEVDALLNEMAIMLLRWSLYTRFLADKCSSAEEENPQAPEFLTKSALAQKLDDRIIGPYNAMTTFFLRRSVEKAFQLDEQPVGLSLDLQAPVAPNASGPPFISSVVDDIMYIVNKVLQQSVETGQSAVVTSVIFTLNRVLGSEFIGMIQRKMRDEHYPRAVVSGAPPPAATVVAFLVLINNLDVAVDYVHRIASSQLEGDRLDRIFPKDKEAEIVRANLNSFTTSFESKVTDLLGDGIQVVHINVIKARLRPILSNAFRDVDYQPSHFEEYSYPDEADDGENEGSVPERFMQGWIQLMLPISRILTQHTFERLLSISLNALARLLEKRIWAYHGRVNSLGATRLERDVRGLVNEAVSVGGHSQAYKFRNIFARCTEIVLIMGLEEEEWQTMKQEMQQAQRERERSAGAGAGAGGANAVGVGVTGGEASTGLLSAEERTRARAAVSGR